MGVSAAATAAPAPAPLPLPPMWTGREERDAVLFSSFFNCLLPDIVRIVREYDLRPRHRWTDDPTWNMRCNVSLGGSKATFNPNLDEFGHFLTLRLRDTLAVGACRWTVRLSRRHTGNIVHFGVADIRLLHPDFFDLDHKKISWMHVQDGLMIKPFNQQFPNCEDYKKWVPLLWSVDHTTTNCNLNIDFQTNYSTGKVDIWIDGMRVDKSFEPPDFDYTTFFCTIYSRNNTIRSDQTTVTVLSSNE